MIVLKNYDEYLHMLYEGLIRSYNINSTKNIVDIFLNSIIDDYSVEIDNDKLIVSLTDKKYNIDVDLLDILLVKLNTCGYYPSFLYLTNNNNMEKIFKYNYDTIKNILYNKKIQKIKIFFEKKIDDEITITTILYHVCNLKNLKNILKKGLVPKNKNKKTNHPERIYFSFTLEDAELVLKEFKKMDLLNNLSEQNYKILQITQTSDIRFYKDPNYEHGCYTYQNINKNLIIEL